MSSPGRSSSGSGPRVLTRPRLVRLVAVCVGFAVAALASELVLRLTWTPVVVGKVDPRGPHPDYGFAPLPGATGRYVRPEYTVEFRHTAQRMRGARLVQAVPEPGVRARVLLLGDSFTYGTGNEEADSFAGRLAAGRPDVEFVNTGCGGYSQVEELGVLDRLGGVLRPQLVVLFFFWNDLELRERLEPEYEIDAAGSVRRVNPPDAPSDPLRSWPSETAAARSALRTCYLFEFLRECWWDLGSRAGLRFRTGENRTPEDKERAWQLVADHLRMIRLRAAEIGSRLVVVCIPDYCQVDPAASSVHTKPIQYEVQDRLAQVCSELGIDLRDALPAMRAAFEANGGASTARTRRLYYLEDRHLTPLGNAAMAAFVEEVIRPMLPPPGAETRGAAAK